MFTQQVTPEPNSYSTSSAIEVCDICAIEYDASYSTLGLKSNNNMCLKCGTDSNIQSIPTPQSIFLEFFSEIPRRSSPLSNETVELTKDEILSDASQNQCHNQKELMNLEDNTLEKSNVSKGMHIPLCTLIDKAA